MKRMGQQRGFNNLLNTKCSLMLFFFLAQNQRWLRSKNQLKMRWLQPTWEPLLLSLQAQNPPQCTWRMSCATCPCWRQGDLRISWSVSAHPVKGFSFFLEEDLGSCPLFPNTLESDLGSRLWVLPLWGRFLCPVTGSDMNEHLFQWYEHLFLESTLGRVPYKVGRTSKT